MLPRLALTFALAVLVRPAALYAQAPQPQSVQQPESDGAAPAHVSHVDGTVSLEREGRAETAPLNMPLLSGDRLRTVDGRVEVLFTDGSTLHLDMRSTIDVQSDDLVRLTDGRLRVNILGPLDGARGSPAGAVSYRIDSPAGSVRITQPGEYRIALLRPSTEPRAGVATEIQLELAVVRGAAEIFTDQGSTPVRAGERAYASAGLVPSYAYAYNSAAGDGFDHWSEARRDVRLGVSSQYLPSDMQAYAPVLNESGDWRYTESSGYAWYPRVSAEWRPYYYGRWASYPRYGWTWIGADRFAWPTHHYGRWGFSAGVWFWRPSSRWAPAHVSWGYAPGYVSWCPLGFDNRPVFGLGLDLYRVGPGYYSPWRAWTAVSYSHFGGRDHYVNQRAVHWDRFDRNRRPRFETRPSAPGFSRDIAVPRSSTPIRWAGSRELPARGGSRDLPPNRLRQGSGGQEGGSHSAGQSPSAGERRTEWLPPSGGRSTAVDRQPGSGTPRYVNRGDEIIRSQTERPTPPAAASVGPSTGSGSPRAESRGDRSQGMPSRGGYAVPRGAETRTIPEGPAREVRPDAAPFDRTRDRRFDPSRASASPRAESRGDGAQGRPFDAAQGRPDEGRPMAQPRMTESRGVPSPGYQSRGYEPRARPSNESPNAAPPAPDRDPGPRAYERSRPGNVAQPAPRQPERATPERAPNRGEGRQPPAPSRADGSSRAGSSERAAPRTGTAVPRGGRGGI